MDFLSLPLSVSQGKMVREEDTKRSIDTNVASIIMTPKFSCYADIEYGFVFNNFRFNIFNENEGVVFDSKPQMLYEYEKGMYDRKISGKSNNFNTFASELNLAISTYEPRLRDVKTSMVYRRDEKRVYITLSGTIISTGEPYNFTTTIKTWN